MLRALRLLTDCKPPADFMEVGANNAACSYCETFRGYSTAVVTGCSSRQVHRRVVSGITIYYMLTADGAGKAVEQFSVKSYKNKRRKIHPKKKAMGDTKLVLHDGEGSISKLYNCNIN